MINKLKISPSYSEVVQYLFNSLPVFEHRGGNDYKPGLQTISELDNFFGSPHGKYKTIHVAGTNGKGSVSHLLAAALQGAGYRAGLFTSPHLLDFRERIRINGEMITEDEVIEFVKRCERIIAKVQPSFFELTVAMAFDHFARHNVDVAVIETGMGGRLDATNIIQPVTSVITNVSMDHTQFLGNNLISIASEKAGIIKPGTPVVIGETQPGVETVFQKTALEAKSPVIFADRQLRLSSSQQTDSGQIMYFEQNNKKKQIAVEIDMFGNYQQKNLITALVALQYMRHHAKIEIKTENILPSLAHAAKTTGLQGRWQIINKKPFTVCDIAHNAAGWGWITAQLKHCSYSKLHIVAGFVRDKDISEILEMMPVEAVYYFTKASVHRALHETELMRAATRCKLFGNSYQTVSAACNAAYSAAAENDMILIAGSAFVVGEALLV